ncbi:RHS repeat-associated core domain-containing protein [Bradyrhizobium sp. 21]|uniref:RHS repeat domain-containing protein n=1 Tax=Bradyrhizobium sp. 21 TaxID=2782666 RepID=UPI001FF9C56F|nr:RHS repeat-associated core domain-containing protein [Bradyrhizobium sp. 21]MCK1383311.1 hypothetical protein [Bradyrhizobium sp. 21]
MRTLQTASETLTTRYFHTDQLGSISVITNENALVVERLSYDAWGKRRNPNGTDDTTGSISSQSTRGFTGEEQLSIGGLVHLNGRVYDPLLARFTSADPTVTDPMNMQGWNRYSYVGNDPLAFTDPNGFSWFSNWFGWIGKAFTAVGNFIKNNIMAIAQIAITVALTPLIGPYFAAFAGSAIVTGISGGSLSQALKAGLIAGATAFAFAVVGGLTNVVATGDPSSFSFTNHIQPAFGTSEYAFNVAGHAAVGCGSSVASGGSCQSGALSAGVTAAARPTINKLDGAAALTANTVLGGVASVAGGGKFANGAVTGAFGYLFNSQFKSRQAVPFLDDQGQQVLDYLGQPMMRPSDVDPAFFVDEGKKGGYLDLGKFGQGKSWDVQRVDTDRLPTPAFIDYATVGIGLFAAAAGIPEPTLLSVENNYAWAKSNFGNVQMDATYKSLPARNVFNTKLGYQLFQSGRINGTP